MKQYIIEESDLEKLLVISKRLYTENRMNGDEMRDAAQTIDRIVIGSRQLELPPVPDVKGEF